MARKGQKFNKYSPSLKKEVTDLYFKNETSLNEIAKLYNIKSIDTILSWVKKYSKEGENSFLEKRGLATKKTSPLKGRPRKRFVSKEEKEEYFLSIKENERKKILNKEEKIRNLKKL